MKPVSPGVRVSAGSLKGRRLEVPRDARPTEGKVREALFSILAPELEGARFLDLFAGSGAVGLEAVSRGALNATFVESDRRALSALSRNLSLAPQGSCELVPGDVDRVLVELAAAGRRFEIIFADPPYSRLATEGQVVAMGQLLVEGGRLAFEHSARAPVPLEAGRFVRIETRRYGLAALSFYGST